MRHHCRDKRNQLASRARCLPALGLMVAMGVSCPAIAQDGGLDPDFGPWGGTGLYPVTVGGTEVCVTNDAAVQADDYIVLVGSALLPAGNGHDFLIQRLDADGVYDLSFGDDGRLVVPFDLGFTDDDQAQAVAIEGDGKIVAAGWADSGGGDPDFAIIRLNSDGSPDTTFGAAGKVRIGFDIGGGHTDKAFAVALQDDGKIVVAGVAYTAVSNSDFAVLRLLPGGTPDPSFGSAGKVTVGFDLTADLTEEVCCVAVQDDGKIVVAGTASINDFAFHHDEFALVRLTPGGELDTTFGDGGKVMFGANLAGAADDVAEGLALRPDGRLVVAGGAHGLNQDWCFEVAGRMPDGTVDTSMGPTGLRALCYGTREDRAFDLALQSDGKAVMAGLSEVAEDEWDMAVVRVRTDGQFDETFGNTGRVLIPFNLSGASRDEARAVVIQSTHRIVAAGAAEWPPNQYVAAAGLQSGLIFADGFEDGSTARWAHTAP